ncbi:hypothetical protein BMMON2_32860 [Burkholderia mallei]
MPLAQRDEALRDVVERLVPCDAHEAAVGLAAQRVREAIVVMLVVRETRGLLAQIAFRNRMIVVASDLRELAVRDVDDKAAIARTQNTGGFLDCHRTLHLPAHPPESGRMNMK